MKPDLEIQKEYSNNYLLEKEKEVFGFYLSSHPAIFYKKDNPNIISLNKLNNYFTKSIDVIFLVDKIKVINTKNGDKMAFITGSDETATAEFTFFPKIYKSCSNITKGDLLKVRGMVDKRYDQYQIVVNKVKILEGDKNE